jgi:hypothetical protein
MGRHRDAEQQTSATRSPCPPVVSGSDRHAAHRARWRAGNHRVGAEEASDAGVVVLGIIGQQSDIRVIRPLRRGAGALLRCAWLALLK